MKLYVIKDLQENYCIDIDLWNNENKEELKQDFTNHIRKYDDKDLSYLTDDEILSIYEYKIELLDLKNLNHNNIKNKNKGGIKNISFN